MGNSREEKMTDGELGYIAGMIDGDGCIGAQKNSNCKTYRPYIVVAQKNPAVIDWLHERFGGYVDLVYRKHGNRKCHYLRWVLTNQRAVDVLNLCLRFLVSKHEQAKLAIALVEDTKSGYLRGQRVPDELIERQKNFYLQIKGLNSPATTERAKSNYLDMQQSELTRMKNRQKINRSINLAVVNN